MRLPWRLHSTLVFAAALVFTQSPAAPVNCETVICRLIDRATLPSLRWSNFSDDKARLHHFYEKENYAYAWLRLGTPTPQALILIDLLTAAETKGLNPEDYGGPDWPARIAGLRDVGSDAADTNRWEFDLALTVSAIRFMSDLHFGRANPGLFHAAGDPAHLNFDVAQTLRARMVTGADLKSVFRDLDPPFESYRRTEAALKKYIALAKGTPLPPLTPVRKTVEPGAAYVEADGLRRLLSVLGDLTVNAPGAEPAVYASDLVDAVKRFQRRHGIEPDGRLGAATVARLNVPLSQRVRQLEWTLERWRWIPHPLSRPPIVVNIPEFELRALDTSFGEELEMKVVVGNAYGFETPVFAGVMDRVIFRPYWNVPRSILVAELLPKIQKDSSYLAKNQYQVVTLKDKVVTNGEPDDATIAALRAGALRVRQTPGPKNSLGLISFVFPNPYDVYLHGTPSTTLFARSRRDFSHGCIRVERPELLAAWVLRNQPEWTAERIAQAMNGDRQRVVSLASSIPVLVTYATAVVLKDGEVRFFEDIYKQDEALARALAKRNRDGARPFTSGGPAQRPRG